MCIICKWYENRYYYLIKAHEKVCKFFGLDDVRCLFACLAWLKDKNLHMYERTDEYPPVKSPSATKIVTQEPRPDTDPSGPHTDPNDNNETSAQAIAITTENNMHSDPEPPGPSPYVGKDEPPSPEPCVGKDKPPSPSPYVPKDEPPSPSPYVGKDEPPSPSPYVGKDEPPSPSPYVGKNEPPSPSPYVGKDEPPSPSPYVGKDESPSPSPYVGTDEPSKTYFVIEPRPRWKESDSSGPNTDSNNQYTTSFSVGSSPAQTITIETNTYDTDSYTLSSSPYPAETETSGIDTGISEGESGRTSSSRSRSSRREDPRRHTLATNNLYVHAHHPSQISLEVELSKRGKSALNASEYATVNKYHIKRRLLPQIPPVRKAQLPQGYPLPNNAHLFEDDSGVMSEVETSSTGFRRGGKQRSSLPVVRTPSKTLERPLGLVFLQYRTETKRALLPNEITSLDTVKALFVRSFTKQLDMKYLESPGVKIYIHDSSKDMFYELEDVRSHLRDIRDRSVLRLFESSEVVGGSFPGTAGVNTAMPSTSSSGTNATWENERRHATHLKPKKKSSPSKKNIKKKVNFKELPVRRKFHSPSSSSTDYV